MGGLDHVPDARDGLTLVERALLLAAPAAGTPHEVSTRTLERAVAATGLPTDELYESLVSLARGWEQRYPLVDGEGNFGSVHDDPAADPAYTEVRRTQTGEAVLGDDTLGMDVDPSGPAPGAFPTLLANGSWEGIAELPPHNLGELTAAITLRLQNPHCPLDDVLRVLPGPDFASGGELTATADEIRAVYETGSGEFRVRATSAIHREPRSRSKQEHPVGLRQLPGSGHLAAGHRTRRSGCREASTWS